MSSRVVAKLLADNLRQEINPDVEHNQLLLNAVSTATDEISFVDKIGKNPLIPYNTENTNYDIKKFLSRPIICSTPSWNTVQVQGTNLMNMSIPGAMLTSNPVWENKLSGIMGFKATLCFKVQFNCQKFQSGIALVSILPASGHIPVARKSLIESDIFYKSQLPSVRYNISELDEVTIRVPYTSPELFYNRTAPVDWATAYLDVYYPLVGGDLTGTCWCWFEDVELFQATAMSGNVSFKSKKRNVSYSDQEDTGTTISQTLNLFSRGFAGLSNNIPTLSSVTLPTAWFLSGLSKTAAAFGYSSTVDTSFRHALVPKSLPHTNNCDTNDTSDSAGLFVSNKVSQMTGFAGSDIDEMSLSYVVQIPSYLSTQSISKTQVAGTKLFDLYIHPSFAAKTKTITPATGSPVSIALIPPVGYIATTFAYWRGSLKYRFFIAKTEFHTGRIVFQFAPGDVTAVSNTFTNGEYVQKWIWDLQDSSTFEITVPYVNSACWSETLDSNETRTGTLTAFVLNPLNAPTTVANSVGIIVEVAGGPDFEVAGAVSGNTYTPILAYSGDVNLNRKFAHRERVYVDKAATSFVSENAKRAKKRIISQKRHQKYVIMAEGPLNVEQNSSHHHVQPTDSDLLNTKEDSDSYNALFTIGESVKSLRNLLKRTGWFIAKVTSDYVSQNSNFNPYIPFIPVAVTASVRWDVPSGIYVDYYSKIAPMYALRRGGIIIRHATDGNRASVLTTRNTSRTLYGIAYSSTGDYNSGQAHMQSRVVTINENQGSLDVLIPFHSRTTSMPVFVMNNPSSTLTDSRYYASHCLVTTTSGAATFNGGTQTTVMMVGRKIADDFSLGAFIGVLPLVGLSTTFPFV